MKEKMRFFKGRTPGFYIGFVSACLMFLATIVFIAMDSGDSVTFSPAVVVLLLLGSLSEISILLFDYRFLPVIPALLYAPAVGIQGYLALQSFSDVWNNVNFVGGNGVLALVFWIVFLVLAILAVVSAYMSQYRKEPETVEA